MISRRDYELFCTFPSEICSNSRITTRMYMDNVVSDYNRKLYWFYADCRKVMKSLMSVIQRVLLICTIVIYAVAYTFVIMPVNWLFGRDNV